MFQLGEKRVGDFMTSPVISVNDIDRLSDAIRMMEEKGLSAVPVVDNQNAIVGLLSTSDLLNVFYEVQTDLNALHSVTDETRELFIQLLMEAGDQTCVKDVMRSPVVTTSEDTNLVMAAQLLHGKKYHHLPVVSEEGMPVGILSTSDFVRAIAEHGATMAG